MFSAVSNAISVLSFFIVFFLANAEAKVKVSVYYESLCPDSRDFITNQLHDAYKVLGSEYIDLDLVPYGKVTEYQVNGTTAYSCQHGEQECYGNQAHGCALKLFPVASSLEFVTCSEAAPSPASNSTLEQCSDSSTVLWTSIKECLDNGTSQQIFHEFGERTKKVSPKFVPSILFNNVFNQTLQDISLYDFKGVLCRSFDNKPTSCQQIS